MSIMRLNTAARLLKIIAVIWWCWCFLAMWVVETHAKVPPSTQAMLLFRVVIAILIGISLTPVQYLQRTRVVFAICLSTSTLAFIAVAVSMVGVAVTAGHVPAPDMLAVVLGPIVFLGFAFGAASLPSSLLLSHLANKRMNDSTKGVSTA